MRRIIILIALVVCARTASAQRPGMSGEIDLLGRHPELFDNAKFNKFRDTNKGIGLWYESAGPDDTIIVNVVGKQEISTFFGQVKIENFQKKLIRTDTINLDVLNPSRDKAIEDVLNSLPDAKIARVMPAVAFTEKGRDLAWRIDAVDSANYTAWYSPNSGVQAIRTLPFTSTTPTVPNPMTLCNAAVDDSKAGDDIHHLDLYRDETLRWVSGIPPTDVVGRARAVLTQIAGFLYQETSLAEKFSLADNVVQTLGGFCDEYSTVLISHLRSIDIRSEMKYLLFDEGNNHYEGHACVELFDENGVAHHLDPVFNKFDERGFYRTFPNVISVKVKDVRLPDDRRFQSVDDPSDVDGILSMYDDFCEFPTDHWEERPGYTF